MLTLAYYTGEGFKQDWLRYIKDFGCFLIFSPFLLALVFAAWIWVVIPLALWLGYSLKTVIIAYGFTCGLLGSWYAIRIYILEEYIFLKNVYAMGGFIRPHS